MMACIRRPISVIQFEKLSFCLKRPIERNWFKATPLIRSSRQQRELRFAWWPDKWSSTDVTLLF